MPGLYCSALGSGKTTLSRWPLSSCKTSAPPVAQLFDHLLYQDIRRGCPGGEANGVGFAKPVVLQLAGVVDEVGRFAQSGGQFAYAVGVGAVGRADDQHDIAALGQLLDGVLAVLGGVADVVFFGALDGGELCAQGLDNTAGVVHGEGGLGDVGQLLRIFHRARSYYKLCGYRFCVSSEVRRWYALDQLSLCTDQNH